ncbi:hypothetical protein Clacol_006349 [Clathrus columnatus]|uniref:Alpha N-terminal protein methyltransferase 1 n=1 Tax=Clathrus columnatus TaxID=1419009 RepID=A0AAV5AEZ5_9AGAM|nr:hypothetical protein Clacol_006349 [Clathrus columnatus]
MDSPTRNPDFKVGIQYWNDQPASLDGVLGGFGSGSLPRIDALGSRQFLQRLLCELCTIPSAIRPLDATPVPRRLRALDIGAGIGRATQTVLLHLFSDIVLVEPVQKFVETAYQDCLKSTSSIIPPNQWKGISNKSKSVTFVQESFQTFNPLASLSEMNCIGRLGYEGDGQPERTFDVIWCQWCLGHLSDLELIGFFQRAKKALRSPSESLIIVKENVCHDLADNTPQVIFDQQDSSLTRSDAAWLRCFNESGLTIVCEETQNGFPHGLYTVKMYALRPVQV